MTLETFSTWLPMPSNGEEAVDVLELLHAGTDELRALWDMVWAADVDDACNARREIRAVGRAINSLHVVCGQSPEVDTFRAARPQ